MIWTFSDEYQHAVYDTVIVHVLHASFSTPKSYQAGRRSIVYIKLSLQKLVVLQSPKVPLVFFGYSATA